MQQKLKNMFENLRSMLDDQSTNISRREFLAGGA
jgi:hypothetical protein